MKNNNKESQTDSEYNDKTQENRNSENSNEDNSNIDIERLRFALGICIFLIFIAWLIGI